MRKQSPPYSIQIELNEGCNLGCSFCGLRGMREKGTQPWYRMKRETAERIIAEIKRVHWHSRIIFSMHGEPTLNPNAVRIIKLFRKTFPNTVMSMMSNGYGIVNGFGMVADQKTIIERVYALRNAGLNDLIIDYYSDKGDARTIEDAIQDVPDLKIEHLARKVPLYSTNPNGFRVLFNPPIQKKKAINRHLCNHCGAAGPLDMSYQGKRCARPFRELAIRYDGSVAICCNDFRGEYPIGNIMEQSIEDIWYSKRFEAARILLYAGERSFKPCYGCNAMSHRVGLLPRGGHIPAEEEVPEPNDKILNYARSISKNNKCLCKTLYKRSWEE